MTVDSVERHQGLSRYGGFEVYLERPPVGAQRGRSEAVADSLVDLVRRGRDSGMGCEGEEGRAERLAAGAPSDVVARGLGAVQSQRCVAPGDRGTGGRAHSLVAVLRRAGHAAGVAGGMTVGTGGGLVECGQAREDEEAVDSEARESFGGLVKGSSRRRREKA